MDARKNDSLVKNVLLVTNSTTDWEITLIKEAITHAKKQNTQIKLTLVHVIPTVPTCYFNIPSMAMLAENYYEEAKKCLTSIGNMLNIGKHDQWLITGRTKTEVSRLASKLKADFILASSVNIPDLHKPFLFRKRNYATQIRSINTLVSYNF